MNAHLYHYRGRVKRVVDGDTLILELDVGFHSTRWESVRLLGINTPEMVGVSRAHGQAAKALVEAWLAQHDGAWPLIVRTEKTDSFGRYLADVWSADTGESLNAMLQAYGYGAV